MPSINSKSFFLPNYYIFYFLLLPYSVIHRASQVALVLKNSPPNAGDLVRDTGSTPDLERSPGGGHGSPLQHSCLVNPINRGAWPAIGHRVAKSQTWLKPPSMHAYMFSSVQSLSHVWLFVIPWIAARQASLSITSSQSLLKLMSIESVMPSSHLILCHPLFLLSPIPPSITVFSNESTLHMKWPKYWSVNFSISPSNEHPGLISFRMDWLDFLTVQETPKCLLQHHSSKASIFRCSAFFTVQLSHPYMTTGKTIALTRRTFVGKVMSLLFNMLSRLVITFLPRCKRLLISWLQSPSAVILEPKKIKSDTASTVSPSISHEVMGPDAMILAFWMLSFKPTFSLSSFTFIKRLFSSSSLSAKRVVSFAYRRLLIFLLAILMLPMTKNKTLSRRGRE